jgi:pyruvate,water dikinase
MTNPAVYANLSVPRRATEAAAADVEGIGLLRSEFLVYQTGRHPALLLEDAAPGDLGSVLGAGMKTVAAAMFPRPVLYRTLDLRSNELRGLQGGESIEVLEDNPALGCRGLVRSRRDPETFMAELHALGRVRKEGYTNLHVMLPFVRWPAEVEWVHECMEAANLTGELRPKLYMMVETPASVFCAEKFAPLIDGVSIGSNDLTQLVLGVDRDNYAFAQQNSDEDPAVFAALKWAIDTYNALGIPVGICGDAPSRSTQLLSMLCDLDLSSISVSLERVPTLRSLLSERSEAVVL